MKTLINIQKDNLNKFGHYFQNVEFINDGDEKLYSLIEENISDEIEDIINLGEIWWSEFIDPYDDKHYIIIANDSDEDIGKFISAEIFDDSTLIEDIVIYKDGTVRFKGNVPKYKDLIEILNPIGEYIMENNYIFVLFPFKNGFIECFLDTTFNNNEDIHYTELNFDDIMNIHKII